MGGPPEVTVPPAAAPAEPVPAPASRGAARPAQPRAPLRRAPLAPVAGALAVGIALGRFVPAAPALWGALGGAALLVVAATMRREHLAALTAAALMGAIAAGGALSAHLAWGRLEDDHIATFTDRGDVLATVRARVVSSPLLQQSPTAFWRGPWTSFLGEVTAIRQADGQWRRARGALRISVSGDVESLAVGEEVELVGRLSRIRSPDNPGQQDWRQSDRLNGVLARFRVPDVRGVARTRDDSAARRACWRLRGLARRHFSSAAPREEALLLEALILGQRDPALGDLNRAMAQAGTAHLLSISGTHLGVFLGLLYGLCRLLGVSPRRAAAAVLVVLGLYVVLAEARAPLLRSAIMAGAVCVAAMAGRRVWAINTLSAAAIVLLVVDPLELFHAGFQLSFAIVAGMAVLHRPLRETLFGRFLRRRGLRVYRGPARARRWLAFTAADGAMSVVCLSVAAFLAGAPLVAYHFGLFSPAAPLLSLLLMPLVTAVLVPSYLSMAMAPLAPNLAGQLAAGGGVPARWLADLSLAVGDLPGICLDVAPLSPWLAGAFYGLIALWLLARKWPAGRWLLAAATVLVVALTVASQWPAPAPAAPRLHLLDVGHGQMALLHNTDGRTYLFDAGTLGDGNAYEDVLRPFLRVQRLPHPTAAFVSHANLDHYNALAALIERRPLKRLYVNASFEASAAGADSTAHLLETCDRRGVVVETLAAGATVELAATRVEVLWPPTPPPDDPNDASLVLRIVAGARRVLAPGDIGAAPQQALLAAPQALASDVLILPHHGSVTPPLAEFIAAVGPTVVLQSGTFRKEKPPFLNALTGRERYWTFRNGWTCVELAPRRLAVQTMRN